MEMQSSKSVMSHNFSKIPSVTIPRSVFDRSCGLKTTFEGGSLVPIFTDEVLPGDTFSLKANLFGRLATPIFPIMDNIFMETFWFFVPNRILWDNWEKFNGAQDNPGDSTDFTIPQVTSPTGGFTQGSVGDFFGLPIGKTAGLNSVNAFHFRAYNLIYREWFRDENLINSPTVPLGDGPDLSTVYPLRLRGKRHDYFTSALPFAQKGDAVALPLGTSAPVVGTGLTLGLIDGGGSPNGEAGFFENDTDRVRLSRAIFNTNVGTTAAGPGFTADFKSIGVSQDGTKSGLQADLSNATAATINALREAFSIQAVLERDARGGTRYTEMIKSHFGVTNPDFRLQRPEYLGGSSDRININPVQQTSSSDEATPQGNLAAYGVVHSSKQTFTKSFTEHGVIIGLVNVRADITYQQGLHKMWSRSTRFDFYLPALAHLGEDAILNKEIFYDDTDGLNDNAFGFQERWAEYRYKPSQITSKFRTGASGSLDSWHLSQNYTSRPNLNEIFINDTVNVELDRIQAVPSEPDILLDCYFQLKCARPMPVYSVPGLASHF